MLISCLFYFRFDQFWSFINRHEVRTREEGRIETLNYEHIERTRAIIDQHTVVA